MPRLTIAAIGGNLLTAGVNALLSCRLVAACSRRRSERTWLEILLALVVSFVLGVRIGISLSSGGNHIYSNNHQGDIGIQAESGSHATTGYRLGQRQPRIFCWILTTPQNHERKARHVRNTWARRCDKFVFVSSRNDPSLPSIDLGVTEGYDYLWAKTKAAFKYAYKHHLNDCDFFLKADDDTYVVLENLRYMLKDVDPNEPLYIGRRFRTFVPQGFMSGGAGYVLSREAVRRFVQEAIPNTNSCSKELNGPEDVNIGICLDIVGVKVLDSLDELGRERFHPYQPWMHLHPHGFNLMHWIWNYNYHPLKRGADCCSNTTVSFHYVTPGQMRALDFLIYQMQPHAIAAATVSCNRGVSVIDESSDRRARRGHNIELASLRRSASDALLDSDNQKARPES